MLSCLHLPIFFVNKVLFINLKFNKTKSSSKWHKAIKWRRVVMHWFSGSGAQNDVQLWDEIPVHETNLWRTNKISLTLLLFNTYKKINNFYMYLIIIMKYIYICTVYSFLYVPVFNNHNDNDMITKNLK